MIERRISNTHNCSRGFAVTVEIIDELDCLRAIYAMVGERFREDTAKFAQVGVLFSNALCT